MKSRLATALGHLEQGEWDAQRKLPSDLEIGAELSELSAAIRERG